MAEGTGGARLGGGGGMARVNLTLPDRLLSRIREEAPELNLSRVFREAIGSRLDCEHGRLVCLDCSTPLVPDAVARPRLRTFWLAIREAMELALIERRSLGSAIRATRDAAVAHGAATGLEPLPRLTRAEREQRTWRRELAEVDDVLPRLGYLELLGKLAPAATLGAWRRLGEELAGRPEWRFEVNEDALPMWVCEADGLTADVGLDRRRRPQFELYWHTAGDIAHNWSLRTPAELVQVASKVRAGEELPEALMLGPWIEEEFLAGLAGREAAL